MIEDRDADAEDRPDARVTAAVAKRTPSRMEHKDANPVKRPPTIAERFPHYHRRVPDGAKTIDVYRLLAMFDVTDPNVQHAIKKLLVLGKRGGGKSPHQDMTEVLVTLQRWVEMRREDEGDE